MNKKLLSKLLIIIIFVFGFFLRTFGINWDQGFHLHPDERFLTMVSSQMTLPLSFLSYLNQNISTFNPTNIGFDFYVYGVLPLSLNKLIAILLKNDNYDLLTYQGRFISALLDSIIILIIFYSVKLFERFYGFDKRIKFFSAFFYAIAVLPIQLSHFFIVDTFLNFFIFICFYLLLRFIFYESNKNIILASVFFGFALSSKISAVYFLPFFILLILFGYIRQSKNLVSLEIKDIKITYLIKVIIIPWVLSMSIFAIFSYLSLRLTNPYYFQNSNILIPILNSKFTASIATLDSFSSPDIWYPPAVQWINKTKYLFSLNNLILYGFGVIPSFLVLLGLYKVLKKRNYLLILTFSYLVLVFIFLSSQFAFTMRYFLFLYPYLTIFTGLGLYVIYKKFNKAFFMIIIILSLIWPASFMSIYTKNNTRVEATRYIYENIKPNSTILIEHWDDPLPLILPDVIAIPLNVVQIPVFDPDTSEKWITINSQLQNADYYILSSNRAWASIPTVPEKYPLGSRFYKDLFEGKLGYTKIKEIKSIPSLRYLNIPIDIDDSRSEEAFTVYDHPTVIIFKNNLGK